jgi:hypothetical protein
MKGLKDPGWPRRTPQQENEVAQKRAQTQKAQLGSL